MGNDLGEPAFGGGQLDEVGELRDGHHEDGVFGASAHKLAFAVPHAVENLAEVVLGLTDIPRFDGVGGVVELQAPAESGGECGAETGFELIEGDGFHGESLWKT